MIEGIVNIRYEAVVALTLQGPQGKARDIEAVIDTGYNGFLTLSTALVTELELPFSALAGQFWPTEKRWNSVSTMSRFFGLDKKGTSGPP